jgi:phosphatidylglycerophosphate synthase
VFDAVLRKFKDDVFKPITLRLLWIHPAVISLAGVAAGIGCAFFLYYGNYTEGFLFWILNRILDGLDGAVARGGGKESDLGGYIDIVADFAVYAIVPIALAAGKGEPHLLTALSCMLGAFYVNAASWMYLSAILEKRHAADSGVQGNTAVVMPAGIIAGTETLIIYSVFILFNEYALIIFYITTGLVLLTILQRLLWGVKNLK